MKRLLITASIVAVAASTFAQGTVNFITRASGIASVRVLYNPAVYGVQVRGNGSTDTPGGTQDWSGYTALTGTGYSVALASSPTETGSLVWAPGSTTSFRTGSSAGAVAGNLTLTLANVAKDAATAYFQIFAWDNQGGTLTDPTAAWTAWQNATTAGGTSVIFSLAAIGGDSNVPANVYSAALNAVNPLTSFNIYYIPEPSTMALAGLGAAALLIFRRRK